MGAVVEALVHGARPPVTIETIPEEAALAQASIAVYVLQMGLPAKFFNEQIWPTSSPVLGGRGHAIHRRRPWL